ncbi:hypothetical protein SLEP1_g42411 [Rubroshorea leprosula]|uniref:Uncharacterized protein n=1 Tax=Rubroshorea leprosula TaxID=152421 RepID=A0AAV5L9T6_9ROSI|nr:hypothetical protein SLEP1_g42411 [Rubroshorea leprosula]
MEFFRELRELQGNQEREEEEGVVSVEPITMVVPLELQDFSKAITLKSSPSSSAHGDADSHHSSTSNSPSAEATPHDGRGEGNSHNAPVFTNTKESVPVMDVWENIPIIGKLDNIYKVSQNLPLGFRFRVALHHDVADDATTITRFNNLERWCAREDLDAEDDVPFIRRRTSSRAHLVIACSSEVPSAPTSGSAEARSAQGMHNFVPFVDQQCVKSFVQQNNGHATRLKLMDAFNYVVALFECKQGARGQARELKESCKWLTSKKVSLEEEVNHLQSFEMTNRAAFVECRADELNNKVLELKEELEKVQVEKESGIQVAKEEAWRVEERVEKVEAEREGVMNEFSPLRARVAAVDQNVVRRQQALDQIKLSYEHSISMARAQRAEWLLK